MDLGEEFCVCVCVRAMFVYLLLGLQALWIHTSHVVGLSADIIVSFVLDKVHTGIVGGLCRYMEVLETFSHRILFH